MGDAQQTQENAIVRRLREWNSAAVAEVAEFRGELTITVPREHLRGACDLLRTDPEMQFVHLCDATGVDRFPVEPRFEVNYHLVSLHRRERVRLKVRVSTADPVVESVTSVWPTANWHEREIYDLFGVRFEGHPNLRRILMPDDWEGHPLRRDYPTEGFR
jgi:NADH-quinone oxidoreductase subunit C